MAEDIISLGIEVETIGAKEGASALDVLAKAGADAEKATDGLASATKRTSSVMAELASVAKTAAAVFGIYKIADYARDAALLNARYETLGVAMTVVGQNAGYSASQMEAAAVAMQKTGISMVESRQQAMRLVQAHIDLADSTKLARIAQDAAVIGGINSSEAFSRMIHGITTGQTEVLRGIGLNVSMEQSYKTMAASLHKNADALSQNEKMQAIVNAVMERGKDIAGSYEAAMDTAGKQMASMARYTEDLKVKQGEVFNESLTIAVMAWTAHLKDANGEIDKLAQNKELEAWGRTVTDILAGVADNADNLAGALKIIGLSVGAAAAMAANAFNPDALKSIKESYNQDVDAVLAKQDRFSKAVEERRAAIEEKKNKAVEAERQHQESMTSIMLYYTDLRIKGMMTEQQYVETVTAINKNAVDGHHYSDQGSQAPKASGLSEYQRLTKAIEEKIAVQNIEMALGEKATEGEKAYYKFLSDITGGYLKLTNAEKSRLTILHDRQLANEKEIESEKFLIRWKKSLAEEESAVHGAWMDDRRESLETTQKEIAAQEEHNLTVGMSKENLAALADARYADAIASKQRELAAISGTKADEDQKDMILSEIKALEKLRDLKSKGTMLDAATDAAKKADEEWKKTAETIERSLTDSLMRGFESGKGFAENFRDTLVNMFKTLVLRPIIQGVVQGGLTAVGLGAAGTASATGGTIGAASNAISLGNTLMGGSNSLFSTIGTSSILANTAFGAGLQYVGANGILSGLTSLPTLLSAGEPMLALGAALPGIGTAIAAIALITSLMGKGGGPKTGGDSYLSFTGDTASAMSSSQLATLMPNLGGNSPGVGYFTPDNGNAMASQIIAPVGASIAATIKSLGGTADGLKLGLGYDTDPQGDASSRVQSGVYRADGSKVYDAMRDVGRDADMTKEMTVELNRMTLAAISAADGIPKIFKTIVAGIDLATASAEQMTATLTQITNTKTIIDFTKFDPFESWRAAQETASAGVMGAWDKQRDAVSAMVKAFDGSATATANLAAGVTALATTETQVVAYLNQSLAALRANTQTDAEGMYLSTLSNKDQYAYRQGLSTRLEGQMGTATTPEQVMSLYNQLRTNYQASYGLLDSSQQAAEGSKYFGTLNQSTGQFEGGYLGDLQAMTESFLAPFGETIASSKDLTDPDSLGAQIATAFGTMPESMGIAATALESAAASFSTLLGNPTLIEPDSTGKTADITGSGDKITALTISTEGLTQTTANISSGFNSVIQQFLSAAAEMKAAAAEMKAAAATPVTVDANVNINATVAPGVEVNA